MPADRAGPNTVSDAAVWAVLVVRKNACTKRLKQENRRNWTARLAKPPDAED